MRTFIGELIFRFKDDASQKAQQAAKTIGGSIDKIEAAAKRMNGMPWGAKFTAQLDKLGASAKDIDHLRTSWERLQTSINSRGLKGAAARAELESFKVATLGHFAQINSASAAQFKAVEKRARTFSKRLQDIMKPAMVMMGGYTGAYLVGVGGREAITAASNEQRERARQHFAGLPAAEQAQIEKQSQELSVKYRVLQSDVMELMREARLNMPNAEAAFGVAEQMVQAYKMLGMSFSSTQSIEGLRAFNKAMDNINVTENSTLYTEMLNSFVKAQQITGKDMDPEAYAQAIKYARTSGKVFSPYFLQNMMPFLIAESGGSDTGNQMRAFFDQFVGGTATGEALNEQGRLGLRGSNGKIRDPNGIAYDPLKWISDNIVPALAKDGVNMNSDVEIAQAVSKMSSNRLAREFIQRAITQRGVYMRLAGMMGGASGIDQAGNVDAMDPFSAFKGFKDAMANLAAAVVPIDVITSGLNSLSNAINTLQVSWRDGDIATRLGIGAAGAGAAFGAWKIGGMVWGLMTAGANLNAAAVALEAAAVSLGAAGASSAITAPAATAAGAAGGWGARFLGLGRFLGGAGGSGGGGATAAFFAAMVGLGLLGRGATRESKKPAGQDFSEQYSREENAARNYKMWNGFAFEGGMHRAYIGAGPKPGVAEAEQTGKQIQEALSPVGKPTIDTSQLQQAVNLAQQFLSLVRQAGAAASQAAGANAEMRRSFQDYGVSP